MRCVWLAQPQGSPAPLPRLYDLLGDDSELPERAAASEEPQTELRVRELPTCFLLFYRLEHQQRELGSAFRSIAWPAGGVPGG